MGNGTGNSSSWSLAERIGLAAHVTAAALAVIDIRLAAIPLVAFLVLCLVAPFFTRLSFYLPIVSRGKSGKQAVALTFDDGPDPASTPELLRLLATHRIPATFFITGKKAAAHPELIREIVEQGHTVGNHSYSHDIFIMFKGRRALQREIETTQSILHAYGIRSFAFRPPVGITNPLLKRILRKTGMYTVNFSCRALDVGNRRVKQLAEKILKRIQPDDIVILHDIRPKEEPLLPYWLNELELMLSGIEQKGLAILPLSEIIGKPVMQMIGHPDGSAFRQHRGSEAR